MLACLPSTHSLLQVCFPPFVLLVTATILALEAATTRNQLLGRRDSSTALLLEALTDPWQAKSLLTL